MPLGLGIKSHSLCGMDMEKRIHAIKARSPSAADTLAAPSSMNSNRSGSQIALRPAGEFRLSAKKFTKRLKLGRSAFSSFQTPGHDKLCRNLRKTRKSAPCLARDPFRRLRTPSQEDRAISHCFPTRGPASHSGLTTPSGMQLTRVARWKRE
jgi:hypothetical protein